MGCLKVDIQPVSDTPSVGCDRVGGMTVSVRQIRRKCCGLMKALVTLVSGLFISAKVMDSGFNVDVNNVSGVPSVSLSIVCGTNYGTEYYLSVLDGCLLTIDGCYLKVMR